MQAAFWSQTETSPRPMDIYKKDFQTVAPRGAPGLENPILYNRKQDRCACAQRTIHRVKHHVSADNPLAFWRTAQRA
jgi:hypothetical protein